MSFKSIWRVLYRDSGVRGLKVFYRGRWVGGMYVVKNESGCEDGEDMGERYAFLVQLEYN